MTWKYAFNYVRYAHTLEVPLDPPSLFLPAY